MYSVSYVVMLNLPTTSISAFTAAGIVANLAVRLMIDGCTRHRPHSSVMCQVFIQNHSQLYTTNCK